MAAHMTGMTFDAHGSLHAKDGKYAAQNRSEASTALLEPALNEADLKTFTDHYLVAALWSTTAAEDEDGEFLDENYGIEDVSDETRAQHEADIQRFASENRELIAEALTIGGYGDQFGSLEQVGHDFWLTRNGHGVGFWDRGLGEVGNKLSEAARAYGEVDLYVGDDGKLYA